PARLLTRARQAGPLCTLVLRPALSLSSVACSADLPRPPSFPTRRSSDLEDQDRSRWDPDLITEGLALVEEAAGREDAGRFTVQAAIAALHSQAPRFEDTDWAQIVSLYSMLLMHGEDPVVRMNRAIAIGRRDGPESGLTLLEELSGEPGLAGHHPYYVALALFLTEIGDRTAAERAWDRALELAGNTAERRFIERRRAG